MDPSSVLQKLLQLAADLEKSTTPSSQLTDTPNPKHGVSLLQAKTATLLRYNLNLIRFLRLKTTGQSIQSLAPSLIQDWIALERIHPLEKKIRHQIDALLSAVAAQSLGKETEAEKFARRKAAALFDPARTSTSDDDQVESQQPDHSVVDTQVAEDVNESRAEERQQKERIRKQSRLLRDEGVQEALADLQGRPDEIRDDDFGNAKKSSMLQRLLREDEKRMQYEEEHMTRLNLSKKDKKRKRDIERAMMGPGLEGMDEFSGLIAVADRVIGHKKGSRDGNWTKDAIGNGSGGVEEDELKVQQLDEMLGGSEKKKKSGGMRRNKRRRG
eukprot:GFKZ01015329.1.p1 GENE.GFKZ01015329.1~~GFKZ01015329.1.p1  ORF type:complete len:328 (-),score=82.25 GFKZ01015329.1:1106-2089(-)